MSVSLHKRRTRILRTLLTANLILLCLREPKLPSMVIALIARFRPSIRWDLNNPQYCRLDLFFHCFRLGKKKEESFEKGFAFCAQRRESIPLRLQCCRNPVSPPAKIFNHDCYYYARAIFSELARCIGEQKKKS